MKNGLGRQRAASAVAVLGIGKAGGALVTSFAAARVRVVARARRLRGLERARGRLGDAALFLAVPDDALPEVAAALARWPVLPRAVAHLSGARGLDVLAPLEGRTVTASFHPLASLDGAHAIPRGTLIAWDTRDSSTGTWLAALARRLGGVPARVRDDARALYHAGAVVAGNLPVALLYEGTCLLVDAGVPEQVARVALARLLRSQAEHAERMALARALTGPVARGDADTLARHLARLDERSPRLAELYRGLTRILIEDVARPAPATAVSLERALARARR